VVLQGSSRRALSTGFACEEDDARGAEHRNESTAAFSPYRTMRYGVVIAFLASSLVHGDLLAHGIARANAIRQLLQYGSPAGSQQARLLFKISVWVSLQSEFSNDQVENSALLSKRLRSRRDFRSKDTAAALCGM
jgi:hypothetical protein